jgi:ElaB/YqjD/DUF883 family membrane-anchored ribosome-binding protein
VNGETENLNPTIYMQNRIVETRQNLVKDGQLFVQDVDKLKRDAVQIAEDVRDHANAHVLQTRQRITDTVGIVRDTFTTNPLALVGVGVALGLFLAFTLRRRSARPAQ